LRHVDLGAVKQAVAIGVGIEGIGAVDVDLVEVGEALAVGIDRCGAANGDAV